MEEPAARAEEGHSADDDGEGKQEAVPVALEDEARRRGAQALDLDVAPLRPLVWRVEPVDPGVELGLGEGFVRGPGGPVKHRQQNYGEKERHAPDRERDDSGSSGDQRSQREDAEEDGEDLDPYVHLPAVIGDELDRVGQRRRLRLLGSRYGRNDENQSQGAEDNDCGQGDAGHHRRAVDGEVDRRDNQQDDAGDREQAEGVGARGLAEGSSILNRRRVRQLHVGGEDVHSAYSDARLQRLGVIKAQYDPANLFRFNQNIPPAKG